ncbi:hypothetical protein ACIBWG_06015 [Streptomyces griseoaurantiacus]|uniref:hypothetical protein n=1 Tax=Streptomyces TaxID=1883 RepID=UPI0029B5D114|nr:hypothetical protein [Streptomyces sp. ME02-6978.2a]MDX3362675.1 hypothetical protein [Streptomyces sp. ME02-6978.2a]
MTPAPAPGVRTVIGVDAGSGPLREADHLIHDLVTRLALPPAVIACTHPVRTGPRPHLAVSLALPDGDTARAVWRRLTAHLAATAPEAGAALGTLRHGPHEPARAAARAAGEHAERTSGRAVVYPGADRLTGTLTLERLLADTAVDDVTVLGTPEPPAPTTRIDTRGHVRPTWRGGRLTLALSPAPGGLLAPFEVPNPTPCCADHG